MQRSTEHVLWILIPTLIVVTMALFATVALSFASSHDSAIFAEPLKVIERTFPLSKNKPNDPETVIFTGDVMLGRYVETLMATHNSDYPFFYVSDLLQSSDLTFVNLEGPVSISHVQTPDESTSFSFDQSIPSLLRSHGIDAVALGNNHASDRGQDDYENTVSALSAVGIASVGHSIDASGPIEIEVGDETLRFFSFNDTFPFNDANSYVQMVEDQSTDDMIDIVNIHWGAEYQLSSNLDQQELAHSLVDAGADLIIGHHPHVVQEIEQYNDVMIFYSLGNFIFDQYFSNDVQQGLVVQLTIDDNNLEYSLVPIKSIMSRPQTMSEDERVAFLKALAARSDDDLERNILDALLD
ncbi:CapA family protein [Candidatus Uhrbacteria bacterium]|jgi:gamma-polyglutamate biosynthesis protein CapA|nr:CapA family protein [Candidatus Uhrbacteria bacterium]